MSLIGINLDPYFSLIAPISYDGEGSIEINLALFSCSQ